MPDGIVREMRRIFADASVDVAHARWAYFFGPGCEPGLRELARVVRRGGAAFVIDNDATRSTFGAWFRRELPRYDVRARMASVHTPALLIVGSGDPYRPHMEWLADAMPSATLRVMPHAGHFPFVEQQRAFTRDVAAFLND